MDQLRAEWLGDAMIDQLAAGDAAVRRALEELARQPDGHRPFEHPFHWGAFICQGDVAPLTRSDPGAAVTPSPEPQVERAQRPYCSASLPTPRARQCFQCGMDWHDPENVVCRKRRPD